MTSIYMRNLCSQIWKRKKLIAVCIVVFVIAFAGLGYKKAKSPEVTQTLLEQEEFEAGLQKYAEVQAGIDENLVSAEAQVASMEKFCEDSIFMNLDPLNVQFVTVSYSIQASDAGTEELLESGLSKKEADLINVWTSYVKDGNLVSGIQAQLEDPSLEYLQDVISCSATGNVFTISLKHYDLEMARVIQQAIREQVEQQKEIFVAACGEFSLTLLETGEYVKADVTVQNTQNSYLASLNSYRENMSNWKKEQLSQQISEKTFREEYAPKISEVPGLKVTLIQYAALGLIAGIIIPCVLLALGYILSDRIKGKENLIAAGLTVFGEYQEKKGYVPELARSMVDVEVLVRRKEAEKIYLNLLGDSECVQRVATDYAMLLKHMDVQVASGSDCMNDAEQMRDLIDAGQCILFVEAGKTTCTQMEEQLQMCRKFDVSVWGCVVIE